MGKIGPRWVTGNVGAQRVAMCLGVDCPARGDVPRCELPSAVRELTECGSPGVCLAF